MYHKYFAEFIRLLKYTHARQTALCFWQRMLSRYEDAIVTGGGLFFISQGTLTVGQYMQWRHNLNGKELFKSRKYVENLEAMAGFRRLKKFFLEDIGDLRKKSERYFELMYRTPRVPIFFKSHLI